MKNLVLGQKERIGEFLKQHEAWGGGTYNYEAIGLEENGELIAGVIYDGYEAGARISSYCAGVGKRWLNRDFLRVIFDYPFNQLGVNVVVNVVSTSNDESMRFTEHLGFKEIARIEGGASDGDLIIYVLYKKDCKWIRT